MSIYLGLLAFIFFLALVFHRESAGEKGKNLFLFYSFLAIFLIYALRAETVGRDLPGYAEAYRMTRHISFFNFDYLYFEKGYLLLMKLFTVANIPFQWFLAFVSAVILAPIYIYIKKYSSNYFLSVLVYICYMFFEFNLTGIRQALATSILLIGITLYMNGGKRPTLKLVIFTILAAGFHKGAYIMLLFPLYHAVKKISNYIWVILFSVGFVLIFRNYILSIVKDFFEKDSMQADAEIYFGLNLIFTILLGVFFIISYNKKKRMLTNPIQPDLAYAERDTLSQDLRMDEIGIKLFLISIVVNLLFGSDTAARSYMMYMQVIIIMLPNSICAWRLQDRAIFNTVLTIFLSVFFYAESLLPNNFDIVPYQFFWQ